MKKIAVILLSVFAMSTKTNAQGRLKAGLGLNYISNTYQAPHLTDYFATSGNISYTFIKAAKFGLSIESATSIRIKGTENDSESGNDSKFGFTSSLPIIASLRLKKTSFYVGSGPAYVKQTIRTNQYYERASDYYLNTLAGVGFTGKPVLSGILYPEYNIRISYLKCLNTRAYDGGMISFIVFLKG